MCAGFRSYLRMQAGGGIVSDVSASVSRTDFKILSCGFPP
jgi:hypothetical protein